MQIKPRLKRLYLDSASGALLPQSLCVEPLNRIPSGNPASALSLDSAKLKLNCLSFIAEHFGVSRNQVVVGDSATSLAQAYILSKTRYHSVSLSDNVHPRIRHVLHVRGKSSQIKTENFLFELPYSFNTTYIRDYFDEPKLDSRELVDLTQVHPFLWKKNWNPRNSYLISLSKVCGIHLAFLILPLGDNITFFDVLRTLSEPNPRELFLAQTQAFKTHIAKISTKESYDTLIKIKRALVDSLTTIADSSPVYLSIRTHPDSRILYLDTPNINDFDFLYLRLMDILPSGKHACDTLFDVPNNTTFRVSLPFDLNLYSPRSVRRQFISFLESFKALVNPKDHKKILFEP